MSLDLKELLLAGIMPVLKSVGKAEILDVLAKVQSNNTPQMYEQTLKAIHSSFSLLKEVTVKTKTKIDDGIVDLILEAVEEAASDAGIDLTPQAQTESGGDTPPPPPTPK